MLLFPSFYGSELTNCQKHLGWRGLDSRSPSIVLFSPLQQMSLALTGWWGTAGAWLSPWLWTWLLAGCAPQNTTAVSRRWSSAMPRPTGWVLPNSGGVLLQVLVGSSFERCVNSFLWYQPGQIPPSAIWRFTLARCSFYGEITQLFWFFEFWSLGRWRLNNL